MSAYDNSGSPDLSTLTPQQQQDLFSLSTEEERRERLAKQKAQAQALLAGQHDASQYRTPMAGLFGGLGDAANRIRGRVDADSADSAAKQLDAQKIAGLQALLSAKQGAYDLQHPPLVDAGQPQPQQPQQAQGDFQQFPQAQGQQPMQGDARAMQPQTGQQSPFDTFMSGKPTQADIAQALLSYQAPQQPDDSGSS